MVNVRKMKSARKAQKIVLNQRLINQLQDKDIYIDSISEALDRAHDRINRESKHMLDLASFLKMDTKKDLLIGDVVTEVKKRLT